MRRKDKQIHELSQIEDIIRKALVCRLGLSMDNIPYIVPMCFGYQDKTLFLHSAQQGLKLDIIRQNPSVCFEFDENVKLVAGDPESPCKWGMAYRSVTGKGKAQILSDPAKKTSAFNIITAQYGAAPQTFSPEQLDSICVIEIKIDEMTGKKSG